VCMLCVCCAVGSVLVCTFSEYREYTAHRLPNVTRVVPSAESSPRMSMNSQHVITC
jgi:hypothetical protein